MKHFFVLLCAITIYATTFNVDNCMSQWLQMNGPNRGFIYCFASNGSNVFAGSYGGGVFRSTNNGESWFSVNNGLTNPDINSLLICDSNIFVGTRYSGVFRSTDNGGNWFGVNNGLSNLNIEVLYSRRGNIFAGTTSGIFISTNYGSNWTACGLTNKTVKSILIIDSVLFVGTYGNGIFYSNNYGVNWTSINIGLTNLNIQSIAANGNYIFAATQYQVYRSVNNGAYWTYLEISSQNQLIVNEKNIFALGNGGVLKSTNYGLNWTAINNGFSNYITRTIHANKTNLFVGSEYGVQASSNNGENWAFKNKGITNELVLSLAECGPYIFAATESNGLFKSSDNGLNWDTCGLKGKSIFALTTSGINIFAGTVLDGGIFLTSNYGESWTSVSNGLTDQVVLSLVINGNSIFAGTGTGVFRSTNNGNNWIQVNNGINPSMIYALAASNEYVYAGSNSSQGGIYRTSDNGQSWMTINNGLTNKFIRSLLVSGTNIYAGTSGGVFLSTNSGDRWESIGLTNLTVYSLTKIANDIIAGTTNGIYHFNSFTKTWFNRNQGFSLVPRIYCLLVTCNKILAGTDFQSVWSRNIFDIIGIQNISTEISSAYSLSQNYPNPFNPSTMIKFSIIKSGDVKLVVYDVQGREVQTLVNERLQPGTYETTFDGSTQNSGVYFYKLITGTFSETKKMLMIK